MKSNRGTDTATKMSLRSHRFATFINERATRIACRSTLLLAILITSFLPYSWAARPSAKQEPYDYTPNRTILLPRQSVILKENWNKAIQFLYNRGKGAVHYETVALEMMDAANLQNEKGYISPENTRIDIFTYEIRSIRVIKRLEERLKEGYNVRVTADPSTFTYATMPSKKTQASWTEKQRAYFIKNYDTDKDGVVTEEDLVARNNSPEHEIELSHEIWEQLKKLQNQYPKQVDLVSSPYELVPADDSYNYPRLTHFKKIEISVRSAKSKPWRPVRALISSANVTDSCMDRRISQSRINKARFLAGEDYAYAKGSEGHIQFGAMVVGEEILTALAGPVEEWISLYKKGKHFDDAATQGTLYPRVILEQKGLITPTVVQAFYSEGTKTKGRKAVDPVYAITNILSMPGVELKVFYSADFVFVHKALAHHLRHHLARGGIEAFGVFIDGNFATEPYSALPDLLFAEKIQDSPLVLPGKAIQDLVDPDPSVEWQKNVFSFEGEKGVYGGPGDKVHAKSSYLEYLDQNGVRHYVVMWGSANKSTNAGRLNADGSIFLDSVDPQVGAEARPFFESLREEARMKPFAEAYLERRLLETINPVNAIFQGKFIQKLQAYLDGGSNITGLRGAIKTLEEAGAVNSYGDNLIKILKTYVELAPRRRFSWADFDLALHVANPFRVPQPGLLADVRKRWLGDAPTTASTKVFRQTFKKLARAETARNLRPTSNIARIMKQCEPALLRLGLPTYEVYNPGGGR